MSKHTLEGLGDTPSWSLHSGWDVLSGVQHNRLVCICAPHDTGNVWRAVIPYALLGFYCCWAGGWTLGLTHAIYACVPWLSHALNPLSHICILYGERKSTSWLERWLSCREHFLLLQRIRIQFLTLTRGSQMPATHFSRIQHVLDSVCACTNTCINSCMHMCAHTDTHNLGPLNTH